MLIYGSGGHAKVVLDCIKANKHLIDGIFDDYSEEKEFQNIRCWVNITLRSLLKPP